MIGYRKYARGHFIPWHALFLAMERVTNSKAYMRVVFLTDVGIKGEAQVVVGILLEFGRWVNQVRGILSIVAVDIVVEGQLLSATCHGTVFGICLDTLYEAFDGFG